MASALGRFLMHSLSAAALSAVALSAWADDFCCQCKDKKTFAIEASDELTAGVECSIKCKRPTRAKAGKCEAPPAAAATAQPDPASSAKGGGVALFASEDCSGEGKRVSASTEKLADAGISGARSYMVESGQGASVWEKAGYSGRKVEPVGVGVCVSPGWEIGSVQLTGK